MTSGQQASAGSTGGAPGRINTVPSANASGGAASLVLKSDGSYTASGTSAGSWVTPQSLAAQWELFVTVTGGSLTAGSTGSWLAMTADRTFTRGTVGSATLTLQWRDKTSHVVWKTQTGVVVERS